MVMISNPSIAILQLILLHTLSSLLRSTDAFSASPRPTAGAVVVENTVQKRTGKHSFLHKQECLLLDNDVQNPSPPTTIATPDELHALATSLSRRTPGSRSFHRGWIHWRTLALDAIRHDLARTLPRPADRAAFENLFFRLGVAADEGRMPSFAEAGARSGYALEFFCRARNLADLYVDGHNPRYEFPGGWVEVLRKSPLLGGECGGADGEGQQAEEPPCYSMVSLGGGPGFDYVGAAVAASFSSYMSSSKRGNGVSPTNSNASEVPTVHATILDYQPGWGDLVRAMANSTRAALRDPCLDCVWGGGCDITQPLRHPANAAVLARVNTAHLWTCQYCVAENAARLQSSGYVFFRDLCAAMRPGALCVLSEVHPRLWPELCGRLEEECSYMRVGFNKNGRQMLLRKGGTGTEERVGGENGKGGDESGRKQSFMSDKDRSLLKKFAELAWYHERKINSGWQRQAPKRRGA